MSHRIFLIKRAYRGRCRIEDSWLLNSYERWFYTFKVIICIASGLEYKGRYQDFLNCDPVRVGMHSFRKFYNYEFGMQDAGFVDIMVGYSLTKNWFYQEVSDGWL